MAYLELRYSGLGAGRNVPVYVKPPWEQAWDIFSCFTYQNVLNLIKFNASLHHSLNRHGNPLRKQ
jgi:hypothetical protein